MSLGLTPQQQKLLGFIERSIETTGVSPTYREMAKYMGFRTPSGVHRLVQCLRERGAVEVGRNQARSIRLVKAAARVVVTVSKLSGRIRSIVSDKTIVVEIVEQ